MNLSQPITVVLFYDTVHVNSEFKPVVSDTSSPMTSARQRDTTIVTFESGERHEIPDAFLIGG